MGIYSARYLESAIDDTIQTPGDTGIDLDQVEEDIAGPNGIASHEEEIEDATEGLVGDPVEEAFMIMYESEYNMNQIMQCIGVNELKEAAMGREFIFEAADKQGFFAKVKEALVNAFKKITEFFKKIINNISMSCKGDYKFVTMYERQIITGASMLSTNNERKFDVYEFDIPATFQDKKMGSGDYGAKHAADAIEKLNSDPSSFDANNYDEEHLTKMKKAILQGYAKTDGIGSNVDPGTTANEYADALLKKLYGGDRQKKVASVDMAKKVIAELKNTHDLDDVKRAYGVIKDTYKDALAQIDVLEKSAKRSNESSKTMTICSFYSNLTNFMSSMCNVRYKCVVKAIKSRRSQNRRLANAFKTAAPAASKPKQESASYRTAFSGIELI